MEVNVVLQNKITPKTRFKAIAPKSGRMSAPQTTPQGDRQSKFEKTMDKLGIWLSGICMVHCILTPTVLVTLPLMSFAKSEWPHILLGGLLPLVTLAAFIPGFRRHRDWVVMELGIMGLVFIIFAALDPFHFLNEVTEGLVTSVGSLTLIGAHLRNRRHHHCVDPTHAH